MTNSSNLISIWSNTAELPQMLGVWESWQILSGGRRDVVLRKSHSWWSLIIRTSDWSVCCTGTICPLGETWLLPLGWLLLLSSSHSPRKSPSLYHLFDLSLKVNQNSPWIEFVRESAIPSHDLRLVLLNYLSNQKKMKRVWGTTPSDTFPLPSALQALHVTHQFTPLSFNMISADNPKGGVGGG